jgi:hypothetical protein
MATMTRQDEIQRIWKDYQGLYVAVGVLLGLLLFPFLELIINDLSQLLIGLVPEAIGIGFTVFFLDKIYQQRETEQLKKRLIREAGGQSNETAKSAVDLMRYEGWLTGEGGLLEGADLRDANLKSADLRDAHLEGVKLFQANLEGANLERAKLTGAVLFQANLEGAKLRFVKLEGAVLFQANLEGVNLIFANLKGADLRDAHLEGVNLRGAYLKGANLRGAYLKGANLFEAHLESANFSSTTTLPDSKEWTEETDMTRFTDQNHPDYWQPPETE